MKAYTEHPVRYKPKFFVTFCIVIITILTSFSYWYGIDIPGLQYLEPVSVASLESGHWWSVFTNTLLHGDLIHLLNNMFSLWYLGRLCESAYGRVRYVELYVFGGIFASLCYVCVRLYMGDTTPAVGASGAIFSLFGAYGSILYRLRRKRGTEWVSVNGEVRGWWRMLLWNLVYGFINPGIANEAHVGGLIFGYICGSIMNNHLIKKWQRPARTKPSGSQSR